MPRLTTLLQRAAASRAAWIVVPATWLALAAIKIDYDFGALEADTVAASRGPVREIFHPSFADQSPLYPLLLKGWTAVLGDSHVVIHAMGLVFGLAAIVLVGWTGRRLATPLVGWTAMIVMACNPLLLDQAQEARCYALYVATAAAAVACLASLLRDPGWGAAAGLTVALVAGAYTHFFAFGVAAMCLGVLVLTLGRWPRWKHALILASVTAVYGAGVIPQVLRAAGAWERSANKGKLYSIPHEIPGFFQEVLEQLTYGATASSLPAAARLGLSVVLMAGLLVLVTVALMRLDRLAERLWFAGWLLLSPLAIYLASADADLRGRYFLYLLPVGAVAVGLAVDTALTWDPPARPWWRRGRHVVAGLALALALAFLGGSIGQLTWRNRPYRDAAAFVEEHYRDGDVVGAFPHWTTSAMEILVDAPVQRTNGTGHLTKLSRQYDRVFFVHTHDSARSRKKIDRWLARHATLIDSAEFTRLSVELYEFE